MLEWVQSKSFVHKTSVSVSMSKSNKNLDPHSDQSQQDKLSQESTIPPGKTYGFNHGFWLTIVALAVVVGMLEFYASRQLNKSTTNSDYLETYEDNKIRIKKEWIHEIFSQGEVDYRKAHQKMRHLISDEFTAINNDTQIVIKPWADWYFSVTGEYVRLAKLIMGDAETYMREQLQERLLRPMKLDQRFEHLQTALDQHLSQSMQSTFKKMKVQLAKIKQEAQQKGEIEKEDLSYLSQQEKRLENMKDLNIVDPFVLTGKVAASVGGKAALKAGVKMGAKTLVVGGSKTAAKGGMKVGMKTGTKVGGKVAQGVVTKIASKGLVKSAVALWTKLLVKFGIKTVAKGGTALAAGTSGSVICSPLGPAALLCGAGAAIFTWFAVDKIVVEVDEHFNRKQFEKDLHRDLTASLSEIEKEMLIVVDDYFDPLYLLFRSKEEPKKINPKNKRPENQSQTPSHSTMKSKEKKTVKQTRLIDHLTP
jgi:hypothetical protein